MFEITGDDIACLRDVDLRELVARLCEAEVRRSGYSPAFVTWGGDQDAPDGGLDVRVELPATASIEGYVPRAVTGIQVKVPDMPPLAIRKEMRRKGKLRPVIRGLGAQAGAYIIVSAKGSTADSALARRRHAMRCEVERLAKPPAVDFYDRTRVASWVRDHPGMIPWVRAKTGNPIVGWQSYGPWAYPAEGTEAEYLIDDHVCIRTGTTEGAGGMSVIEGIRSLRDVLRLPRSISRLVGLSGVGKTRFVQALFDQRVGGEPLDPALALYTNLGDDPDPVPVSLVAHLNATGTRAILIVDNCGAGLHRRLAEVCQTAASSLSVVTIEYDVGEDESEGTRVFRMEPSSTGLTESLVKRRFPNLSGIDVRTIAEASGGNAHMAIALAGTVGRKGTVARLTDVELFRRLFRQSHGDDESLFLAAQACAIVYSFQGEDVSDEGELATLGALVGLSVLRMHQCVAVLRRRELVQRRGVWRAVLPHALANHLAATALETIPAGELERHIVDGGSERLLKSFAHRLGYLHDRSEAQRIARDWLKQDGLLGDVLNLDQLGDELFERIAPVVPEATLAAIERGLRAADAEGLHRCAQYVHTLRSLAYDANNFDHSVGLMLLIAEGEDEHDIPPSKEASEAFESLFPLYLSGTHAPIEQRLGIIEPLLGSPIPRRQQLGVAALRSALEAWQWDSRYDFAFGGHSRNFGYWPTTRDERQHWFRATLELTTRIACGDGSGASSVRTALADGFRGLWTRAAMHDELERACAAIAQQQSWPEGWRAVRRTQRLDDKSCPPEISAHLGRIEELLRPRTLVDQVRAVVLPTNGMWNDLVFDDDVDQQVDRAQRRARELGAAVATDDAALGELLAMVVRADGLAWDFGTGLAGGSMERESTWERLVTAFAQASEAERKVPILCGYLRGVQSKDAALADSLLNRALKSAVLAPTFPELQVAVSVDPAGVERLLLSLAQGTAPAGTYRVLAYHPAREWLSGTALRGLLREIAALPAGWDTAVEILQMRLFADASSKREHDPALLEAGRELLMLVSFGTRHTLGNYRLGEITKVCLVGATGETVAREISRRLKAAVTAHETHVFYQDDLLCGLLRTQPLATMDGLCAGDAADLTSGIRILQGAREFRQDPIALVAEEDIVFWCDKEPVGRYPAIATIVPVSMPSDGAGLTWTAIARRLLARAPDPVAVLRGYVRQFGPIWHGAELASVETHVKLLDEFATHEDPRLASFAMNERARLQAAIENARRANSAADRESDQRFE